MAHFPIITLFSYKKNGLEELGASRSHAEQLAPQLDIVK